MNNFFTNFTFNSSKPEVCEFGVSQKVALSIVDIITFLMGQPVITKLLWITFTSKTTDILNCNLALFLNLQYFLSIFHLIVLFVLPPAQKQVFKFLLVYAQIGGPLSLSFICMQRYIAVIHPTSYPLLMKYRCREVCAVIVWLFALPTAFAGVFAGDAMSSPTESMLNVVSFSLLIFMAAMMVRCSISIGKLLRKSDLGRDKLKKAFKIVCGTSVITLLFYIPVILLQRFRTKDEYTYECIITPVCILLLSAASVVHPLFYLSTQGKLRSCLE